ncbi:hypothetical protein EDB19DRAFT_1915228 [Suillus lakei]|nr:hypothetical protein EDB19DRAFT_1915228 [Suillus lakei]
MFEGEDDFTEMVGQVQVKKNAEGTLVLIENKVNTKEEEQDRIIKDLQDQYHCEDKACPYNICWPAGTSVNDHSLKQAKLEDGIDIDHPPNSKMFDPSRRQTTSTAGSSDDSNDVLALAKQQRNQLTQDTKSSSNITVNFSGLAELLNARQNPDTTTIQSVQQPPQPAQLPPRLSLEAFCDYYDLPHSVYDKLDGHQIMGPHLLHLISNDQLHTECALSIGELAAIQDAKARWKESL